MRAIHATHSLYWLCERASCTLSEKAVAIAAVDDSGRIRGMLAVDDVTKGSCELHIAVETPLALRHLVPQAYDYVFGPLGLNVAVCFVPGDNAKSLGLVRRLGFRETHRVRDGWASGVDMVMHELRRENAFWWHRPQEKRAA